MSRAYYGALNIARAYVRREFPGVNLSKPGDSLHQLIWSTLKHGVGNGPSDVKAGVDGDRLKRYRVQADYHDQIVNLDASVKDALKVTVRRRTR